MVNDLGGRFSTDSYGWKETEEELEGRKRDARQSKGEILPRVSAWPRLRQPKLNEPTRGPNIANF